MCWWRCLCGRKKKWVCLGSSENICQKTSGLFLQLWVLLLSGRAVYAVYPYFCCLPAVKPLHSSGHTIFTHPQVLFLVQMQFFFFQDISAFSFYIHPFPCLHSSIRFIPSSVSSWGSLMVIDFNVSPNILVFAQCLFLLFLLPGHFSSTTVQLRL